MTDRPELSTEQAFDLVDKALAVVNANRETHDALRAAVARIRQTIDEGEKRTEELTVSLTDMAIELQEKRARIVELELEAEKTRERIAFLDSVDLSRKQSEESEGKSNSAAVEG